MGVLAIFALGGLALVVPGSGELREAAIVQAAKTFTFAVVGPGQYEASLLDGRHPQGPTVIKRRVFRFDASEVMELELAQTVTEFGEITAGQVLAQFQSPRNFHLQELEAERAALEAQRSLLAAGGRPEEVRAAMERIQVAKARRDRNLAELERTRSLAASGAVSAAELEGLELQDEVHRIEVDVERASLAVTRSSARPEAIAEVDAQVEAAQARVAELEALLSEFVVSPVAGHLELGGTGPGGEVLVLQVHDMSSVYLRLPIPAENRMRVEPGTAVRFRTPAVPDHEFSGTLSDVALEATPFASAQVFWATARIDNPEDLLRTGMTGQVALPLAPGGSSPLADLWRELAGP